MAKAEIKMIKRAVEEVVALNFLVYKFERIERELDRLRKQVDHLEEQLKTIKRQPLRPKQKAII